MIYFTSFFVVTCYSIVIILPTICTADQQVSHKLAKPIPGVLQTIFLKLDQIDAKSLDAIWKVQQDKSSTLLALANAFRINQPINIFLDNGKKLSNQISAYVLSEVIGLNIVFTKLFEKTLQQIESQIVFIIHEPAVKATLLDLRKTIQLVCNKQLKNAQDFVNTLTLASQKYSYQIRQLHNSAQASPSLHDIQIEFELISKNFTHSFHDLISTSLTSGKTNIVFYRLHIWNQILFIRNAAIAAVKQFLS